MPSEGIRFLLEGVGGVFTINTEAGELICIPHLPILWRTSCPRGSLVRQLFSWNVSS